MVTQEKNHLCPTSDIAAYIDGELSPGSELQMDLHLARCAACSEELNRQKQFLLCLDGSLKAGDGVELPEGFTRSVVARAEANVRGLRQPHEVYNAIFVSAAIAIFILFAAGSGAGSFVDSSYAAVERISIVVSFIGHLVYDLSLGIAVVVKAAAGQARADILVMVLLSAVLAPLTALLCRRMLRVGRA